MPSTATRSSKFGPYADHFQEFGDEEDPVALDPGERIGAPLPSRRRRMVRRLAFAFVLVACGCWLWLWGGQATVQQWAADLSVLFLERHDQATISALLPAARLGPIDGPRAEDAPRAEAAARPEPAAPVATATIAPVATDDPDAQAVASPPERLTPPVAEPGDALQARALAVGLHPGISRAILAKLSAADFRNAGVAIKTALADTPDSEVFVWPRERSAALAVFKVRFVAGAPSDCRRYVVVVVRNGWETTALPMEKCGLNNAGRR